MGKNVFCNACNDFEGTDIDSICRIDRERVTKATFSVLVSYDDVRKAVDRPSETSSCRFDEVFDVWMVSTFLYLLPNSCVLRGVGHRNWKAGTKLFLILKFFVLLFLKSPCFCVLTTFLYFLS